MSLKNDSVLLLNGSFEPIGVISAKRAICLQFRGHVNVEEYHDEKVFRSPKEEWKQPSVVRLKHYINIRKKRRETASKRNRIYIRDKFKCSYCGIKGTVKDLTLDHIIPKCKKGEYSDEIINSPQNLVTCCFDCNQKKRDHTLEQCGMKLLHPPKHLKIGLDKVVAGHWAQERPSWSKYLYQSDEANGTYYD